MSLQWNILPGIKVTNIDALEEKNIDREQLVIDVHQVFFTMLLKHSIFHAGPHIQENIFCKPMGGKLIFI